MKLPANLLLQLPLRSRQVLWLCLLLALSLAGCNSEDEETDRNAGRPESDGQLVATEVVALPSAIATMRPTLVATRRAQSQETATPTPESEASATRTPRPPNRPGTATPSVLEVVQTQAALVPLPPTQTPTRTPRPSPTATPIREADLEQALLTLDDMPNRWEETEMEALAALLDVEADQTIYLCHALPNRRRLSVGAEFGRGELGPNLAHYLDLYEDGAASLDFDSFERAAAECDEMVIGMAGGQRSRLRVSPLPFPELGDETLAVHLEGDAIFLLGRPEMDIIKIREGDVMITLGYFNIGSGGLNREALEVYARTALEQLREVLGEPAR